MIPDPLVRTLENAGLPPQEANVYLALLQLGEGPASSIATHAKLNRSVTYQLLQKLIKRGYASEVLTHRVKRYVAADPNKLLQNIRANVENFQFMLPLLRTFHQQGQKKPRIEFFEDPTAILSVYRANAVATEARYMSSFSHMQEKFPAEMQRWMLSAGQPDKQNHSRHLLVDDEVCRAFAKASRSNARHEVRFLSRGTNFLMDLAIVDERLMISSFDPLFIVVIHSKDLTDSAKILFDIAWEASPVSSRLKKKSPRRRL